MVGSVLLSDCGHDRRHHVSSGEWTTSECRIDYISLIYISQGRYTAVAIRGMPAKPEDCSEAVAELFAAAGARLDQLVSDFGTLLIGCIHCGGNLHGKPTMISAVLAAAAGGSSSGHNDYRGAHGE